jgi:uncharacterized protein DUF349
VDTGGSRSFSEWRYYKGHDRAETDGHLVSATACVLIQRTPLGYYWTLSILDRFRRQPEWKHPDPAVRAAAVRRLAPTQHQDLLVEMARADADPQVRRAAVRKLVEPGIVVGLARDDEDAGVREAALDTLLEIALGSNAAAAKQAAAALDHPRHLAALARDAVVGSVRGGAVRRLGNDRALAALARGAADPDVRRQAVERVADEAALLEIAMKSEHKDAAVAAVERLADRASIESATHARNKAAAKRARAIADARWPPEVAATPPPPPAAAPFVADDRETARYDDLLARHTEEAEQRAARVASCVAARIAICETVEAMGADEGPQRVDEATQAWTALPALEGEEGESLQRRFGAAAEAWRKRRQGLDAEQALRARRDAEARQADVRREAARLEEEGRSRIQALCVRAERLAVEPSPSLKECERTLREARTALEDPGSAKRDREPLMSRLRAARASLYTRVQELRETQDWRHWANLGVQEDLCKEVEALVQESDLPKAARLLRDLDERWKQASQAPKAKAEPLWQRYRTARAQVRARCAVHFAEVRAARAESVRKKEGLIAEAESLAGSTDWARTAERLRAMQGEWRSTGPVTRSKSDELWARFREAGGRFFARQKEDRTRRRAERVKNLERKQELCVEAEALAESSDWDRAAGELKRLQSEWRSTGSVAKDKAEALSLRFRQAGDRFFERYKNRESLEANARLAEREGMCSALLALAASGAAAGEDIAERVRAAQAAWKAAPPLAGPKGGELEASFAAAVEAVVEAWPAAFKDTDLDAAANRGRLEALCATVESMVQADASPSDATASPAAMLAERWREALAANTMGARVDEAAIRRERKEKVEAARAAWARVGPVGSSDRERLAARFRDACRRALGEGSASGTSR